jgi:beta-1,4-mannosyl-glycoprotein beta-1,4-N-acetylglucosaminyltransferase
MTRRPLLIDAFPFHDEIDLLECRLTELYDTVDKFVIVEAEVTHQDEAKPSYLGDNWERFSPFHDKIVRVWATELPTMAQDADPWAREYMQREHITTGLKVIGVESDDIVMQSDADEIPRPICARNCLPGGGFVSFRQRGHFWAVDWQYPPGWGGTVAGTVGAIWRLGQRTGRPFGSMRSLRDGPNAAPSPPHLRDAGWHLSWLGGPERAVSKVGSYCHPEVTDRILGGLANDNFFWREGFHVDGVKMEPVEVDETWPRWIVEGNAPESWYRPR